VSKCTVTNIRCTLRCCAPSETYYFVRHMVQKYSCCCDKGLCHKPYCSHKLTLTHIHRLGHAEIFKPSRRLKKPPILVCLRFLLCKMAWRKALAAQRIAGEIAVLAELLTNDSAGATSFRRDDRTTEDETVDELDSPSPSRSLAAACASTISDINTLLRS